MIYFTELEQIILKFEWRCLTLQRVQTILRNKNKARHIILADIKLYYKALIIKSVWFWLKIGTDQLKRTETSEINLHVYRQLIFGKEQRAYNGERIGGFVVKNTLADVGDMDLIPELGRSSGVGTGNPLQYFCLAKSHGQRSLDGYSPWCYMVLQRVRHDQVTEYTGSR